MNVITTKPSFWCKNKWISSEQKMRPFLYYVKKFLGKVKKQVSTVEPKQIVVEFPSLIHPESEPWKVHQSWQLEHKVRSIHILSRKEYSFLKSLDGSNSVWAQLCGPPQGYHPKVPLKYLCPSSRRDHWEIPLSLLYWHAGLASLYPLWINYCSYLPHPIIMNIPPLPKT